MPSKSTGRRSAVPKPKKRAAPQKKAVGASNSKPKKATKGKSTSVMVRNALDARIGYHLPPPTVTGPYAVVRRLNRVSITTGPTTAGPGAGENVVALFGAYQTNYSGALGSVAATPNYCPVIGYVGAGTTAPADWMQIEDTWATTRASLPEYSQKVSVALHTMTVSIQNSKGTANTEGFVYIGNFTGCPNRVEYASANQFATNVLTRREMIRHSSVETGMKAVDVVTFPVDLTQWSTMDPLCVAGAKGAGFNDTPKNHSRDTLSHIVLVFTPTSVNVTYSVEITTEWRVIYHIDNELASLHEMHAPPGHAVWNSVARAAQLAEGRIANAIAGGAAQLLGGAVNSMGNMASRALGLAVRRAPMLALR